jgi:hypothetical protein
VAARAQRRAGAVQVDQSKLAWSALVVPNMPGGHCMLRATCNMTAWHGYPCINAAAASPRCPWCCTSQVSGREQSDCRCVQAFSLQLVCMDKAGGSGTVLIPECTSMTPDARLCSAVVGVCSAQRAGSGRAVQVRSAGCSTSCIPWAGTGSSITATVRHLPRFRPWCRKQQSQHKGRRKGNQRLWEWQVVPCCLPSCKAHQTQTASLPWDECY